SAPFTASLASGEARAFVDAFTQRFGEAPDTFSAYAYDAFRLVRAAVQGGASTRADLAAALRDRGRRATVGASGGLAPSRGPAAGGTRVVELRGDALVAASTPSS